MTTELEQATTESTEGITVEGSATNGTGGGIAPATGAPEADDLAVRLNGEVIWDGDLDSLPSLGEKYRPRVNAAREAMKKTNAAHQAACNDYHEARSEPEAILTAVTNRYRVMLGLAEGAQGHLPE